MTIPDDRLDAKEPSSQKDKAMSRSSYTRNVSKFTAEELRPFQGQYIAFSSDGTKILAHAETYQDLVKKLDSMQLGSEDYEIEPIPILDSALMM